MFAGQVGPVKNWLSRRSVSAKTSPSLVRIAAVGNSVFHPADLSILSAKIDPRRMVTGNFSTVGVYAGAYDRPHVEAVYGALTERLADGRLADVLTAFLSGRECPFTCVFCDLWQYTTPAKTPVGALSQQLREILASHPMPPRQVQD